MAKNDIITASTQVSSNRRINTRGRTKNIYLTEKEGKSSESVACVGEINTKQMKKLNKFL